MLWGVGSLYPLPGPPPSPLGHPPGVVRGGYPIPLIGPMELEEGVAGPLCGGLFTSLYTCHHQAQDLRWGALRLRIEPGYGISPVKLLVYPYFRSKSSFTWASLLRGVHMCMEFDIWLSPFTRRYEEAEPGAARSHGSLPLVCLVAWVIIGALGGLVSHVYFSTPITSSVVYAFFLMTYTLGPAVLVPLLLHISGS